MALIRIPSAEIEGPPVADPEAALARERVFKEGSPGRSRFALRFNAQDRILSHAVAAALLAELDGDEDLAGMIRHEAAKMAKRWKLENVPGLPETWVPKHREVSRG